MTSEAHGPPQKEAVPDQGRIEITSGRSLFGRDPAVYDYARPGHADAVYELLCQVMAGSPSRRILEIGPGTGQATAQLLSILDAAVEVVEPDAGLAGYLSDRFRDSRRLTVQVAAFEEATLESGRYDLVVAASVFHWLDQDIALRRVADSLRGGGWFAMWWTLFGKDARAYDFGHATNHLLEPLRSSPSAGEAGRLPFGLDIERRREDLIARGEFVNVEHHQFEWAQTYDADRIVALYSTFSPVSELEDEKRLTLLRDVRRIAAEDFDNSIELPLATSMFLAQKPAKTIPDNTSTEGLEG